MPCADRLSRDDLRERDGVGAERDSAVRVSLSQMLKVLLDADVDGLGAKGALVDVKPAYAENFIIKNGLGAVASTKQDIGTLRLNVTSLEALMTTRAASGGHGGGSEHRPLARRPRPGGGGRVFTRSGGASMV